MKRPPVEPTKRLSVSPARRKRVLDAHNGQCYYPGCEETRGLEFEHVIALWMGGKDDDSNTAPMCREHHKAKTALDAKMRAKVKRIHKRDDPDAEKKPSRIQSRGFDKTLRRTFNGRVVPR